jgi:serine/threonine-protein kinase RsbW
MNRPVLQAGPGQAMDQAVPAAAPLPGPPGGWMWNEVFPGTIGEMRYVRSAARALLDGCPAADTAVHVLSELSANAVLHSRSGEPGGAFAVRLQHRPGDSVWGEVEDEGSSWDGDLAASARDRSGLFIIVRLATVWAGAGGSARNRVVRFCVRCDAECAGSQPDGR